MSPHSYLSNAEGSYIEGLYQEYLVNPETVDASWRLFFEGFELGAKNFNGSSADSSPEQLDKEIKVLSLILGYRSRGHLFADTNPIQRNPSHEPDLRYKNFGLTEADLNSLFYTGTELGLGTVSLKTIIDFLEETYCGKIGAEYRYVREPEMLKWLSSRIEGSRLKPKFSKEDKQHILKKLGQAHFFENFLHKRFVGQKRFSLEGAESVIPALDATIEKGAELGIKEFVIGMAHRGRLNVLTNIMQKSYMAVFGEFLDKGISDDVFDGDVKYHMGFSSDPVLRNGQTVHLSLAPNPSHLEAVDPVVIGMTRAKTDKIYNRDHKKACPILIHGDASLAGQGIVYEVIQMSQLDGYEVGGTVHIVINNQVGFTTDPEDSRSSTYCTDVAKVTLSPVFHVNGDDPEAVAFATTLALEFRQTFHRDVFIDIICYRKYGHNEGDEPRFTQPKMYAVIDKHPNPYKIYSEKLLAEGNADQALLDSISHSIDDALQKDLDTSRNKEAGALDTHLHRQWEKYKLYNFNTIEPNPVSKIEKETLLALAAKLTKLPEGFTPHKTVGKLYEDRLKMVTETNKIDWGMGELLAYASILNQGFPVRITGQDVRRGTFSHRHCYAKDIQTNQTFSTLSLMSETAWFDAYNSLLSEFAVLGFEYGYSSANPEALTIWEAQFGDFVNGSQIIIDQFISAATSKWRRMSGLVMLLPHGYEGQGPEHSSCRYERMLVLCAQNNMFMCNFTTPANLFHAFRRQVLSDTRRPLIVATPKSLLRHPSCFSTVEDFTQGEFQEVIDDPTGNAKKAKRLLFCSGKIYYDLEKYKNQFKKDDVAIIRLEQLYPFPQKRVEEILSKYNKAKEFFWVQEEPENMGAWSFILRKFRSAPVDVISRKEAASPATGSPKQHATQQQYIIKKALDLAPDTVLS